MNPLSFFDAHCTVGRRSTPRPENNLSFDELVEAYDRAGIADVLAIHAHAREYDPLIGNDHLSALCAEHPRFHPCYVLMPHWTGEMPAGDALIAYLAEGGVRAVRLFPKDHSFGLGERWAGPLLSTLEEAGVPVFIDFEQTDWCEIDGVLTAHPRLAWVVLRAGYRVDRWAYPLFSMHPTLKIDTSLYVPHRGVEMLTERFGDRLVFGTGMPVWDIGAAMTSVLYGILSDENRRKIAGETLRGILWKETGS
ncbi:MAG: amidohydrolase family protein [candidate division Zixibacteria bacterium]|nr:amidohydrolase family protein [candidate division Zixibacteria bacterium]